MYKKFLALIAAIALVGAIVVSTLAVFGVSAFQTAEAATLVVIHSSNTDSGGATSTQSNTQSITCTRTVNGVSQPCL